MEEEIFRLNVCLLVAEMMTASGVPTEQDRLESTTELGVEDCVDNGIHERVHVSDPSAVEEEIVADLEQE